MMASLPTIVRHLLFWKYSEYFETVTQPCLVCHTLGTHKLECRLFLRKKIHDYCVLSQKTLVNTAITHQIEYKTFYLNFALKQIILCFSLSGYEISTFYLYQSSIILKQSYRL